MVKGAELVEDKRHGAPRMVLALGGDELLFEKRPPEQASRDILGGSDEDVCGPLLKVGGDPRLVGKDKGEADAVRNCLDGGDKVRGEDGGRVVRRGDAEGAFAGGGIEDLRGARKGRDALPQRFQVITRRRARSARRNETGCRRSARGTGERRAVLIRTTRRSLSFSAFLGKASGLRD